MTSFAHFTERDRKERIETRSSIQVAYYWPGEGYGCPQMVETMEQARNVAAEWSKDAAKTNGKAVIHIIETQRTVTTVPYPADYKPEPETKPRRGRRNAV